MDSEMSAVQSKYLDSALKIDEDERKRAREGTGEFLIESLSVEEMANHGPPVLKVRIDLSRNTVGRSAMIEIGVEDHSGNRLFLLSTGKVTVTASRLEFMLKNTLIPGTYYLTRCLKVDNVIVDYIKVSDRFETKSNLMLAEQKGINQINSLFLPDFSWNFQSEANQE